MKDYFKQLFTNNGIARGWLYVIIAFATAVGDDLWALAQWLVANREMLAANEIHWFVDLPLVIAAFSAKALMACVAVGNVIRAYLDQHLTRTKANNEENATTPANPVQP